MTTDDTMPKGLIEALDLLADRTLDRTSQNREPTDDLSALSTAFRVSHLWREHREYILRPRQPGRAT